MPVGVAGELFIGGECVTRGYLGQPAKTAQQFIPDPFSNEPGARLYMTGDLVRLAAHHREGGACECGRYDLALEGGILGRTDDMIVVRGVNIYPTAVEQIIREYPEVTEYQVHVSQKGALSEMHIVIEPTREVKHVAGLVASIEKALQTSFSLRIPVTTAAPNSLPRAELKAKRWLRK